MKILGTPGGQCPGKTPGATLCLQEALLYIPLQCEAWRAGRQCVAADKLHGASRQLWLLFQDPQKTKSDPAFRNGAMHAGSSWVPSLQGATNQEA